MRSAGRPRQLHRIYFLPLGDTVKPPERAPVDVPEVRLAPAHALHDGGPADRRFHIRAGGIEPGGYRRFESQLDLALKDIVRHETSHGDPQDVLGPAILDLAPPTGMRRFGIATVSRTCSVSASLRLRRYFNWACWSGCRCCERRHRRHARSTAASGAGAAPQSRARRCRSAGLAATSVDGAELE